MRRGFFRWGGKIFRRAPRAKTPPHLDGASPHLNFPPASPPAPPGRFAAEIPASSNFFPKSGPVRDHGDILGYLHGPNFPLFAGYSLNHCV